MGRPKKENSIHDIARLSEVSISTVSRVINHPGTVHPDTVARVQRAIEALHFAPQSHPPKGKKQAGRTILYASTHFSEEISIFPPIIDGINQVLTENQYDFLAMMQADAAFHVQDLLSCATRNNVAGIILSMRLAKDDLELLQQHFPCVQCFEYCEKTDCPYVSANFTDIMSKVLNHLFLLQREKIAFVSLADDDGYTAFQRKTAFLDIMIKQGISIPNEWIVQLSPPVSYESAYIAGLHLLQSENRPNAVVCTSDVYGAALIKAAHSLGLKVPDDLIVIGGDNNVASKISTPMLTTIHYPAYEIGRTAGIMILDLVERTRNQGKRYIQLDADLILRASSDIVCKSYN